MQHEAARHGRRRALRARRARRRGRRRARAERRRARRSRRDACARSSRRTARESAAGTVLAFEPDDLRSYGRIVRDADGRLARIVEAADASPDELALREVNSGIYVFRAEKLWPRARPARAAQRAGRALRHRHARPARRRRRDRRRAHRAETAWEVEGINTRVELAFVAGEAPRPDQRGAHARRRHDRRPGLDVDRGRRRDRAGRDDPPVHASSAATVRIAARRRDRARSPTSGRARRSARARRSGRSSR